MKRLLTIKVLVLTMLLATVSVAAVERAFSANGSGVATFVVDGNGNIIGADITGSGNATHLGLFTTTGRINFTPDPDPDKRHIVHTSGEALLTAADGDKLKLINTEGQMDVTTGIAVGKFRLEGGTGRFTNATGTTSAVVQQNLLTGGYELTMVGSIDF